MLLKTNPPISGVRYPITSHRNLYISVMVSPICKMPKKIITKTRYLDVNLKEGSFVSRLVGGPKKFDFSDVALLRQLLSNEKARILNTLKHEKPSSIYSLAKILNRDFKSVREDLKLLERFGFIEFHRMKIGKRESLSPVLIINKMEILLNI